MKRRVIRAILICLLLSAAAAWSDAQTDVTKILTGMAHAYREGRAPDAFKPALAILPFENQGDAPKRLGLAETLGAMVEDTMRKSVDFVLVDRRGLDAALKEVELALSGLGDPASVDLGNLRSAQFLLQGAVGEVPDGFRLSVRLIEVETSLVVFASYVDIDRDDLVRASEDFADRKYVTEYGLGLEMSYSAFYLLTGPMADAEGQPAAPFLSAALVYRPARWLMLSVGFDAVGGQLWLAGTKESTEVSILESVNFGDTGAATAEDTYSYSKTRSYLGMDLGIGFVLNMTRRLNATLGGAYRFAPGVTMTQKFDEIPSPLDPSQNVSLYIVGQASDLFMIVPFFKIQYFLNPRLAVNLRYDYTWQLPGNAEMFYRYSAGGIYIRNYFPDYYGIDPRIDPEGNAHALDFTGHRVSVGVAVYL